MKTKLPSVNQADGQSSRSGGSHQYLKKRTARLNRRAAKIDPECVIFYKAFKGYET